MNNVRRLSPDALCEALQAARHATLTSALDLSDEQWRMPYGIFVQPTAWDLAHIGWFAEFWLLRGPHRLNRFGYQEGHRRPYFFDPDEHYDSSMICHTDRWKIPLYPREELCERLADQLEAVQSQIRQHAADPDTLYFAHLSLFHELMHVEALAWTRAELCNPQPKGIAMPDVAPATQLTIPRGEHWIGKQSEGEFAFDNEGEQLIAHDAFSIDSHPVRNEAFLGFVEDDGYARPEFWPAQGLLGRGPMPSRWRRNAQGDIEHRHYDQWLPLPLQQPVVHISAVEAEAYCRWANRKLPTAPQWEIASQYGMHWGNSVWEWTDTVFHPYPCFRPGPYATYSAPWFHWQREVRGGAYTTHALMHDARYRNFFLPQRSDVFTGFRTVNRH
jgi:gamma-glutamyl hercynylcysteine S-oxide synthase